ncbi:MAG: hypothetical protein JWL62_1312, partial [Hyphomicrobiales bacterium]|nr:hypothetical protein [Hyphomicrobiales bacterium]
LSLTTAITPSGVGHLVLTLRTDRVDFILDNLRAAVVAWNRTGYRIVKRQSAANPQEWVSVETLDSTVPVASARAQDGWLQASEPAMAPFSRAYVSLPGSMAASSATTYGTLIGVPFAMGRETIALLNVARTTPLQL